MREIKDHQMIGVNDLDSLIRLEVADDADQTTGAHHKYQAMYLSRGMWEKGQLIQFHKMLPKTGPEIKDIPKEQVIPNGITHEVLIAVILDRLRCYQKSEFSCRENALAITHLEEALHWLHHRTSDRVYRNVEGSQVK